MKDSSTQGWLGVFLLMGSAQEALETLGADSTAAPALPAKGCQLSAMYYTEVFSIIYYFIIFLSEFKLLYSSDSEIL